jgi:tyrosinase
LGLGTGCGFGFLVCCPILYISFLEWLTRILFTFSIHGSPVFDPITGFGGNGSPGTYSLPPDTDVTSNRIDPDAFIGCIQDGPFKDYTLRFGPGQLVTDHCITRNIRDDSAQFLDSKAMASATRLPTYEEFRIELEGLPITATHKMHDGGHYGIGGEMSNFYSSPGGNTR